MKIIALLMIACLVSLPVIPVKAKAILVAPKEKCCHKMPQHSPCSSKQKDDCGQGMCNIMLSCATCGFLKVDPITVSPLMPVLQALSAIPRHIGDLSDYSISNWNPPRV